MSKMSVLILCLLGLFSFSAGQFLQSGQCDPNIPVAANFDINEFLGTWYEIARSENNFQSGGCSSLQFSRPNNASTTLNAYRSSVVENFLDDGSGTAVSTNGTARLTLNFPSYNALDFWILITDHTNFALAYSCENVNTTFRNVYIWQFGRQTTYPNEMIPALMNTTINSLLGIDARNLESVSHTATTCYVLPVIEQGQPIILNGQCDPNIPVVQNFNVARFLGVWHEISSYYSESATGNCPRAQYTLGTGAVNILNSQVVNQRLDTITGTAVVSSTDGSARLTVTLNVSGNVTSQLSLWVLATDYEDYAVSYTCTNLPNNQKRVFSWILSRNRQLSVTGTTQVNQVVNSIMDLNNRYFIQANQSDFDCFYYPIAAPNQPVIFRGQCSNNIPVVQNFDAARYLGLWHDIQSYPTEFQDGTCSNAYYSLSSNGVDVFNTQVVNQALVTINGLAVVASTDGSAKLSVTFPIAGTNLTTQTDYWVVATDYTSYSLVYSCSNIGNDQRRVTSWKLSRTKQLTPAATTAINAAINTVDVLDQQYYVSVDQSTQGCFYFPVPELGRPVVFPGQCDENIAAVANFNLNQFQGQWFEIEAYPKDQQPGQCVNHQFTVASTFSFNLVSTQVYDQFQGVTNSVVSRSVNEATGRFTITLTTNGTTISFPYWILSTDYTSYALAYSCVNLNSDFRGIWSWKLSRTRALTTQANTAINNVIAPIQVLDNVYYENINQSDDACFYLPEIPPGQPIVLIGQCDSNIRVVQNFNAARYLGRWRVIENYPSDSQEGTCEEANYSLGPDGTVVVFNTEVRNQSLSTITGSAVLATTDGSGKLSVTFPNITTPFEYWILDTDYDSYALVYGCVNINAQQRRIWSWKLSRTNTLTQNAVTAINQVINTVQVLNNRYYQTNDRSDAGCFYFPEPGSSSVVFRGQCDQSIAVVQNFDAVRYMGLWHDIESYPTVFQNGTCNNAYYSLSANGVDVYNTQVINQALDTINGLATLTTTDGSAKLTVSFPIAGTNLTTQTNYWVLATDYNSYSLVYSCRNLNNEERQVSSWKLSRTKQLTAAASTAINNAISNINVLDQRYFRAIDQSPQGCFYFPEPRPGEPVVFPGQCDTTLPVVQNFNFAQFQGLWNEIQAYPKAQESGQCVNHQFSVSGTNGFGLISSSVANQILGVTNSAVTSVTNDGSGRFTITINSNGTVISIPYWILATDYTSYALAYSCLNINSDFRGVWSWKLSRTQSLTAAANTAINNVIAPINVLDNVYYENIDQSTDACFHLPEIPPGQPIVLPGQCDPNITVVQNFNAARYLGRWRLIEGYPSDSQGGTCEEANYSLGPDGTVIVFNTEVRNQSLSTITGTAVLATTDGSGKLSVTFPDVPGTFEYWILDTDYDSFALVYGCVNINTQQRRVWSWKLSRTNTLTANAANAINEIVNRINVLNSRYYQIVDRSDAGCFYFPQPGSNPVVFRGQCDQNIQVVQNFNAVGYMGLWHDIESYPTGFQNGTCSNAYYSLSANGVDVYNTQVINQALDTINGLATLATTDGSAKLIVSFPIAGTNLTTQTNYWVLATDYNTYSLVYSCRNLNNEERQVSSWKLSRTKQLTAAASTAINNAISNINVLDQRYFRAIDQSPQGCFYFPEPRPGEPVVFPGQCDTTLPVVQNFNFAQFQGLWNEIQAYPKDQESGQCVNHQFSVSGTNGFSLISSSVANQILGVTNSAVTSVTNDGSGRFTITINSNGTVISIPYWILATDYTSYALAYSCLNINSDFRGVWSWKLSRTQSLTAAANTAINNVIAPINVLDNVYYENIDQSTDACFHLPEIPPGQPIVLPGQCDPNITVVQNFNAARYLGRWRLIEGYPSDSQGGTCEEANYSLGPDGTVIVFNTEVRNQSLSTITGTAVLATTDGSGKLSVTFPDVPGTFEYWILDTDYDSFALVYGCVNINTQQRRVWSWKLSRTNTLTANAANAINEIVNRINVLNSRYYQIVDRSDAGCFYFPQPGSNPVVFRGQCDQNIQVVQNFNAVGYMGLWHDIESYPTGFQNGTCSNAYYSLSANGVDVYNTQVINQALDTINGLATLATTDGSAKLIVSFPIAGTNLTTQTNYWVLATDYNSYSLVYSCRNLNNEERQVSSWKLSRTKQLTAAASTAINNAISNINVLDQRYFRAIDQSQQGCFYFPDPRPGVPVVFPGQCDTTLPVVQNFNFAQFQGLWHEIQAYPKDQESGQCVNHQFSVSGTNGFGLISSSVANQILGVTNSAVTSVTNDGSGRFTITINSNGTVISIPYWILATDYTGYALAYSCVNINNDFRGVWSWKLSRTQSLTAAANTAINNVIAPINVLDNVYYENIDQSTDACFYLPDIPPGQPIVLPGQCDPNISVVQNFNAARYLGRWRLIEGYPSDSQGGTCEEANYSLGANGTVIVFNTEVRNQSLSTITGSAVLATTDGSGKLSVTFPGVPGTFEYWILDTDYDSYALVYGCVNVNNNQRRVWSWKLSRTNTLTANAANAINVIVNRINVLNSRYYQLVDRSDAACFYFPEPGLNPVVFRGQCDQNIPVVQNFNAVRYMGLWHDIESYPAPFQMGTCSNAEYTLNADGTVSVYNTQVVNQVLDVMTGTAVLASTDGSARLRVTFPVGGVNVTSDYWVLATDYDSYAFVYSCANINAEYREVFSWKLSRQQNLTAAANTVINGIINNVQVLGQAYYIDRDQSERGCFYYPDNFGGDVILPGQCLASNLVQAVSNFNAAAFAGTWYEVARFPSDLQDGECAATEYVLNNQSSYSVTKTIVRNERQSTTFIPSATVSSDGRAIISASVSGVPITSIYILATDYTEYALAYSCRNINAFSKQIYSWKLSRTRAGLSTAANNAINTVVTNNIDLFEGYYSYTSQTNDACFYYPIFDQLPNYITLPGPCNELIQGFPNFNTAAYLGRWMEIARYPQPTQQGQCNRGYYSSLNNVINISSTQVTNRTLLTLGGTAVLVSNDSSAVWNVTFDSSSGLVPTNYYVLATDYTSYALVYSCQNLANGNRRVGSWKLSRTPTLSAQANSIMNAVINNTQGLLEEYYKPTSQSDADCFFVPELTPNEAPLFRGQCENITGVGNFSINRYLGWWHELERYPSGGNAGECRSSLYELGSSTVDVVDTSVTNNNATVVTGTIGFTIDGRLRRTMADGRVQDIWVLDTDYNSYALLYSCENVGDEFRRVWSAKHSRTRQLTQASQNIMAPIIEANEVLFQHLYLPVDQNDTTCFHYPEQTGNRVIIPGQCDRDIPVEQNFDIAAYAGTWYQTERYEPISENVTCVGSRYRVNAADIIEILNWQVRGGVLETSDALGAIASTDGSGRLYITVTTGSSRETITLYVLRTDYNNYALTYNCVNINSYQRAVASWKLSRARTMPAVGTTAINAFMAQRQELHQPYFRQVVQSDDCEEPSSAFLAKSSIIVLLVCAMLQMLL